MFSMSYDTSYYDPAACPQAYSQYEYEQTTYGQSMYDTQMSTQAFTSKPEDTMHTSKHQTAATMLITCCLVAVIALAALIVLMLVVFGTEFGFGTETVVPDDTNAPPLPSLYPVVRLPSRTVRVTMATDTTITTATATRTTITPTASTQSPRAVIDEQPLVCTMGSRTSFGQMFPPDGLCEYIFYDSVEKDNRNALASPNRWGNDLRIFIASYVRYTTTAFGIGFSYDKVFSLVRQLNTTNSSLLDPFWSKNIFHFGILDTATRNARQVDVELALKVLQALDTHAEKQRQQGNPSFIFFAGVIFDDTWTSFYNDKFTNLYKPDLFIAQGHYFYGDNIFPDCRVMPPTALVRPRGLHNYQHDLTMAADTFNKLSALGQPLIWALSVTIKGRWTMNPPNQGNADFLRNCVHNTSAPSFGRFSEICRNSRFLHRSYSQAFDAILAVNDTDNISFAYDNEVALCNKLCAVKTIHPTLRFGIVVYDLEYEDFLNTCGRMNKFGAFSRLHAIRGIINYFRTTFSNAAAAAGCHQLVT